MAFFILVFFSNFSLKLLITQNCSSKFLIFLTKYYEKLVLPFFVIDFRKFSYNIASIRKCL